MNQAHTGEGRYTAQERHDRALELLARAVSWARSAPPWPRTSGAPRARGVLRQGIDLYHAGLIIGDVGGPDALHRVYELFVQAAELGYPGAWAQAAMEYDRWLRAQGKPQRFDSFWRWEGDEQMPEPFAAPAAVEALRAEWG